MKDKSYAVLLLNLGGPYSRDDIRPFLRRLFLDRDIVRFPLPFLQGVFASLISKLRAPYVAKNYALIGLGSPILDITKEQAKALSCKLNKAYGINANVYIGMRYSSPFIEDSISEIIKDKPHFIVVLPLYPHYSFTTTRSSFNEFERSIAKHKGFAIPFVKIREWYDHPLYIKALCDLIKEGLDNYKDRARVHLVFSAHGIPLSVINEGDPYEKQINASVSAIMNMLSVSNPYYVCYQSKVGPLKWLGPSTSSIISSIAQEVYNDILIIPISFVSDHYETSYEIDIEYAKEANAFGISNFRRISALNTHPNFISALSSIVINCIDNRE